MRLHFQSSALANCAACDVYLYNTVRLIAVYSLSAPSDGPPESQPSTSPLISSLSLSSSEENIGKKLLRKLSECTPISQPTQTTDGHQMCTKLLKKYVERILATGGLPAAAVTASAGCAVTHLALITQFQGWRVPSLCSLMLIVGVCKLNTASKRLSVK